METPAKRGTENLLRLNRTPQPEDFGISKETLRLLEAKAKQEPVIRQKEKPKELKKLKEDQSAQKR